MLDFVPLAGAGRQMANRNGKFELVGQLLELDFPKTHAMSVAATTVGGNHQLCGFGMAFLSHAAPPSADRMDGKAGCIVIGPDTDPSDIVVDVVDAVRYGAA